MNEFKERMKIEERNAKVKFKINSLIDANISNIKQEISMMNFKKQKITELNWKYKDYEQCYRSGREDENNDLTASFYKFYPPNIPFEVSFTKFCDYITDPSIRMKDGMII